MYIVSLTSEFKRAKNKNQIPNCRIKDKKMLGNNKEFTFLFSYFITIRL